MIKVVNCLKCKNNLQINFKNISVGQPKMIKCSVCYCSILVEYTSKTCCSIKYKLSLLDDKNNIQISKYKSFSKRR